MIPVDRTTSPNKFGITHLSFYPFDSLAFLSSSYDHTLKIYATETFHVSAFFNLNSVVYSHALSPIADHLLVACATQHPAIRLVDLRSGASAHSLSGHQGAVLSVAWSPHKEHILASGGSDGTVRLWDIRRSAGNLGVLDMDDSVGSRGYRKNIRHPESGKAHSGACNGIVWTDDGRYLVSVGHDERVRVWNAEIGANTLSHFGSIIRNSHLSTLLPMLTPSHLMTQGAQLMLYPNGREILMFDLFNGTLLKRLGVPGVVVSQPRGAACQRNVKSRVTSLAWRAGNVEVFSAHSDGTIRAWLPHTKEEEEADAEENGKLDGNEDEIRKRKRQVLNDIFQDLTKQKITFT